MKLETLRYLHTTKSADGALWIDVYQYADTKTFAYALKPLPGYSRPLGISLKPLNSSDRAIDE